MLTLNVETDGCDGRRRAVASMRIGAPGTDGKHEVTVVEAANPLSGYPARLWACKIMGPTDASIWTLVGVAIGAMADAECAEH